MAHVYSGFKNWLGLHWRSSRESFNNLIVHPFASAMTVTVISIALILPLILWTFVLNLQMLGQLQPLQEIYVFFNDEVNIEAVSEQVIILEAMPEIANIETVSPNEGLTLLQSNTGFSGISDLLESNPLPWMLTVLPADIEPQALQKLVDELKELSGVQLVQADLGWLRYLSLVLDLAQRSLWVFMGLFALGTLLIISNTIRLDIDRRRAEIEIMSLVGAKASYIRRAFLYTGFTYGFLGGLLAVVGLLIMNYVLEDPYHALVVSFRPSAGLQMPDFNALLAALLCSGLLGWCGAFFSVERNLRRVSVF